MRKGEQEYISKRGEDGCGWVGGTADTQLRDRARRLVETSLLDWCEWEHQSGGASDKVTQFGEDAANICTQRPAAVKHQSASAAISQHPISDLLGRTLSLLRFFFFSFFSPLSGEIHLQFLFKPQRISYIFDEGYEIMISGL